MTAGGSFMRNRVLMAGAVLLTLVCLILGSILVYVVLDVDKEASLIVDEVYFIGNDVGLEQMRIDVEVWVTNEGKGGVDMVTVNTFAVETDSNLARANASIQIGSMEGESSAKATLSVEVPLNETYRIEVLVFKDGKLTITGSGILDLTKAGYPRDYDTDRNLDVENEEKRGGGAEDSICIIAAIIGMGILVLVIVLLVTLAAKNDMKGPPPIEDGGRVMLKKLSETETDRGSGLPPDEGPEPPMESKRVEAQEDPLLEGKVIARMPKSLE